MYSAAILAVESRIESIRWDAMSYCVGIETNDWIVRPRCSKVMCLTEDKTLKGILRTLRAIRHLVGWFVCGFLGK